MPIKIVEKTENENLSKVDETRKIGHRPKGTPKTGGRKKGTPNKKTKELLEVLGSFNPAEKLMQLYEESDNKDLKASIAKELMKYVYPQRKAVEMTGDIELPKIELKGI